MAETTTQVDIEQYLDNKTRYAVRTAAWNLAKTYPCLPMDVEDIEQEIFLDLIKRLKKFDPGKCPWHIFRKTLIKNKVATIIEHHTAKKRDARTTYPIERRDILRLVKEPKHEMRLSVQKAFKALSNPDIKRTALQLADHKVSEVTRLDKTTRFKVYTQREKLKEHFEAHGLERGDFQAPVQQC